MTQAGCDWTPEDWLAFQVGYADCARESSMDDRTITACVKAGLDALKHRLAAPAIEPLSDAEEAALRDFEFAYAREDYEDSFELVDMLRRRFPRPAPKPLHRVAFEASLAAQRQHAVDSEQYWQSIAAAVIAADKAGAL